MIILAKVLADDLKLYMLQPTELISLIVVSMF